MFTCHTRGPGSSDVFLKVGRDTATRNLYDLPSKCLHRFCVLAEVTSQNLHNSYKLNERQRNRQAGELKHAVREDVSV